MQLQVVVCVLEQGLQCVLKTVRLRTSEKNMHSRKKMCILPLYWVTSDYVIRINPLHPMRMHILVHVAWGVNSIFPDCII